VTLRKVCHSPGLLPSLASVKKPRGAGVVVMQENWTQATRSRMNEAKDLQISKEVIWKEPQTQVVNDMGTECGGGIRRRF